MKVRKPDSSYASIMLNKRNWSGGAPLSQAGGKPIGRKNRRINISAPKVKLKPEPATDDEPESSSNDECEISDRGPLGDQDGRKQTRKLGTTLQQKIEANNAAALRERSGRKRNSWQKENRKRAKSPDTALEQEELFWKYSQNSKRQATYGSRASRGGCSSDSPLPQRQEERSADTSIDSREKAKAVYTVDVGEGFRFPAEVDLTSPSSRNNDTKHTNPTAIFMSSLTTSSTDDYRIFGDDSSGLSTPLSSASSTFMLELSLMNESLAAESTTKQSLCPVCKKEVDPEHLEAFLSQPKQRVRDQLQFCESHQRAFAEQEWREKGYPVIEWETFNERIQKHLVDLEPLLDPDSTSFYRNVLVSALRSGKAKNFRLGLTGDGLETISCGYYGTRGAGEMLQVLTQHFSRKIHRLASSDQVANMAGVVGYAQFVLVPELTMRLVKEDMNVSDETARLIMRNSLEIGEKMNPAPNDVVPVPEDTGYETS